MPIQIYVKSCMTIIRNNILAVSYTHLDEHLEILGNIVASLEDEELLETLKKNADVDTIMKTFG